jgi:diacylglycerol kinase family enzyme
VVALVGVAGLVAFVIDVLSGNVVNVLLGLVGLAVAVAGTWWVITEGTPRRAIGGVGLAVGMLTVVVGLVRGLNGADRIGIRIVIFAVLLAITMTCARSAMLRELHHLDVRVRDSGAPIRPVLLCNPWSGGGKVERFRLRELATELGVETVMLAEGLDLERLARDAVARGADCLGMAGGDGSQALVASIAVEHGLPFVCVSAGTRNHFALDLGLNHDDPRESMYAFRDAYERTVDFATVNDRFFVNNASLGVYARIVQEDDYREAKVETTKNLLPEMLGRQATPFDLQFTTPDGADVDGAILAMVSNNPYVIGASFDNAQRRHLDCGKLGVFAVTTRTGAAAARLLAAQALGRRTRNTSWHEFTASEFEIRSRSGSTFVGVDGEALELATPLRFRIHPRGLTLLVPAGNIEAAERRRARDVQVSDLFAVAAGHEPGRLA